MISTALSICPRIYACLVVPVRVFREFFKLEAEERTLNKLLTIYEKGEGFYFHKLNEDEFISKLMDNKLVTDENQKWKSTRTKFFLNLFKMVTETVPQIFA